MRCGPTPASARAFAASTAEKVSDQQAIITAASRSSDWLATAEMSTHTAGASRSNRCVEAPAKVAPIGPSNRAANDRFSALVNTAYSASSSARTAVRIAGVGSRSSAASSGRVGAGRPAAAAAVVRWRMPEVSRPASQSAAGARRTIATSAATTVAARRTAHSASTAPFGPPMRAAASVMAAWSRGLSRCPAPKVETCPPSAATRWA